jgi:hypothetical protein
MFAKFVFVIVSLFLISVFSVSAQDRNASIAKLTNGRSKQWVLTKLDTPLGSNKCTRGERWTFSNTGKVSIAKCVNKKVVESEDNWSLEVRSALDTIITVGNQAYTLLFPPKGGSNKEKMILQIKATSITQRTKEMTFTHEVD